MPTEHPLIRTFRGVARRLAPFARRAAESVEIPVLMLLATAGTSVWAFAELADWVVENESRAFDTAVILLLRDRHDPSNPVGPRWVEEMMRDLTALGGVAVLVVVTLATVTYLTLMARRRVAYFVLMAIVGGLAISSALKIAFDRQRPDVVSHQSHVYSASFPSGHSMMSSVTYLTLGALLAHTHRRRVVKRYFVALAALLTVLVGASRIYLGVHWPTDVVAGWAAGSCWAIACWLIALRLHEHTPPRQRDQA